MSLQEAYMPMYMVCVLAECNVKTQRMMARMFIVSIEEFSYEMDNKTMELVRGVVI